MTMSAESCSPGARVHDDALMTRVRNSDPRAFKELFSRHYDAALRYAATLCGNREDAHDLAQEAFIRVYRGAAQYHAQGRFRSWLFTIVRNLMTDRVKRRVVNTATGPGALAAAEKVSSPAGGDPGDSFLDRLSELSGEQREIIVLRVVEEMSYAELASITGLREDHLRQIVSRALAKLREKGASNELQSAE